MARNKGSDATTKLNPAQNEIREALNEFLASVENDAFRLAMAAVKNQDEAIDLVQESMLQLVQGYGSKDSEEWSPLFHRILQNKIRDWYRRRTVKHTLLKWTGLGDTKEQVESIPAKESDSPESLLDSRSELEKINQAVGKLPPRQQQVFLLRAWKEMSVSETASAMSISSGSVKTHYSRALESLRLHLGTDWELNP